jgi:Na+/proline symporter
VIWWIIVKVGYGFAGGLFARLTSNQSEREDNGLILLVILLWPIFLGAYAGFAVGRRFK